MGKLDGKIAVVTGGSRGIGSGICLELAQAGAAVAVNYTSSAAEAQRVVEAIAALGGRAAAFRANVGSKAEVDAMMDEVAEQFGAVDILVNNAGICDFRTFFDIEEETWRRTLDVNLSGMFFTAQAAGKMMRERKKGAIVNVSTVTAFRGGKEQVHYSASKGGVNSLTTSMAVALGEYGIRVNAILCGAVPTDINLEQRRRANVIERPGDYNPHFPARRLGAPEDLGKAVVYLTSDDSSWVTGALLAVDGGALIM